MGERGDDDELTQEEQEALDQLIADLPALSQQVFDAMHAADIAPSPQSVVGLLAAAVSVHKALEVGDREVFLDLAGLLYDITSVSVLTATCRPKDAS